MEIPFVVKSSSSLSEELDQKILGGKPGVRTKLLPEI